MNTSIQNEYTVFRNANSIDESNPYLTARSVEISTQTDVGLQTPPRGGNIIGAIFILMNAVLGAGIIEFPYMFSKVGLITAFFFLSFLLLAAATTHLILAKTVDETGGGSYHEVLGNVCGTKLMLAAQFCLVLYCGGSNIAYMVTVGDQLQEVCFFVTNTTLDHHEYYCDRRFLIPITCCVAILPLIWFKSVSAFGYVSFFSVASVFYLVAAIFVEFLQMDQRAPINIWYPPASSDGVTILSVLPAMSFAYQCHMTSVPLYAELADRSVKKYVVVVAVAMFLATSAYLTVGCVGFIIYGVDVNPDIILSFPADSMLITVGRFAVTLSLCMTYPIVLVIGRGALQGGVSELTRASRFAVHPESERFRLLSIGAWFGMTVLVATFAEGIKDVIAVVGSIAALFMFTFPGCLIVKSSWDRRVFSHVFTGSCFIGLGLVVFVLNIVNTIYEHAHGHPDGVTVPMLG